MNITAARICAFWLTFWSVIGIVGMIGLAVIFVRHKDENGICTTSHKLGIEPHEGC